MQAACAAGPHLLAAEGGTGVAPPSPPARRTADVQLLRHEGRRVVRASEASHSSVALEDTDTATIAGMHEAMQRTVSERAEAAKAWVRSEVQASMRWRKSPLNT